MYLTVHTFIQECLVMLRIQQSFNVSLFLSSLPLITSIGQSDPVIIIAPA